MAKTAASDKPMILQNAKGIRRFALNFKKNWPLHLMMLLPLIYMILFEFLPMYGLQIAFKDYKARDGIWGSKFVGLEHFETFFDNYRWKQYVGNTLKISLYSIAAGFPVPIILALILHLCEVNWLKKLTQNVSYIPHFISTVVFVGILNQVFNPFTGMLVNFYDLFGVKEVTDIRSNPDAFIHLYVWSGVWQGMGWSTIMYVASLSSVSMELHEAAKIDGASRFRRIFAVDIPAIVPIICIQLVLRFGSVMSVGYEKVFLMQNSLNISESEVISTYIYKRMGKNDFSFGTAISLMNSVINTSMVILVNWFANLISDNEYGLF